MNAIFILFIWNISSYPLIIVVFLHRNVDFDFHWCFNVKNIHASVSFVVFKASVGLDMSKSVGFPSEITTTLARIWRLSIIAECPKIAEIFCKEIQCEILYKYVSCSMLFKIPPPNRMQEYDKMIPASKGDGPSYFMLSI